MNDYVTWNQLLIVMIGWWVGQNIKMLIKRFVSGWKRASADCRIIDTALFELKHKRRK